MYDDNIAYEVEQIEFISRLDTQGDLKGKCVKIALNKTISLDPSGFIEERRGNKKSFQWLYNRT